MRLTTIEIANIVFGAFKKAFEEKDKGQLEKSNRFRSAYFVSLIGDKLKTHFKGATTYYQSIASIETKNKKSGEWLFDVCVASQLSIRDDRKGKRKSAPINTNILFACESEFDTSLDAFAADFGKLGLSRPERERAAERSSRPTC